MLDAVLYIWYAAVLAKAFAAYRFVRTGLIARFPVIWAYLVVTATRSTILIFLQHQRTRYVEVSSITAPLILLLEAFCVMEVFHRITEEYPNFGKPGAVFLGSLAGIGVSAASLTRFAWVPHNWSGTWQVMMLAERYASLVMIIVLIGARIVVPRVSAVPIRRSADRAAGILALQEIFALLGATVTIATAAQPGFLVFFIPVFGCLVTSLFWATALTPGSDVLPEPVYAMADPEAAAALRTSIHSALRNMAAAISDREKVR